MDPIEHAPTPMFAPVALVECPHCSGAIHVVLSSHPPIALSVDVGSTSSKSPTSCPHCQHRIWISLRAQPPVALSYKPKTTALIPKERNIDQNATTKLTRKKPRKI